MDVKSRAVFRVMTLGSAGSALGFWVVNVSVLGPRLGTPGGMEAFQRNLAIAVTFLAGLPAAGAAYTLVTGAVVPPASGALQGIGRRTVLVPFGLGAGVMVLGGVFSVLLGGTYIEGGWMEVALMLAPRLLPVGAGFALMGSFAGNLAGSAVLEARDLGRWRRINLVLVISHSAFSVFLMWAVLHLLWTRPATL